MSTLEDARLETPFDPAGYPLLETGDSLTREEFHRRYAQMPEVKKAELIQGIVFMGSPVSAARHGSPHALLIYWQMSYRASTPYANLADNSTVKFDDENELQPDVFLRIEKKAGGQSSEDEDGYIVGAPELVAEVSGSTVSIDRNLKKETYCQHGVREYLIWRVKDKALDWFALENEQFVARTPDDQGLFKSEVFPGLWLDPQALLKDDMPKLLAVLQEGLQSPEHQLFVKTLAERAAKWRAGLPGEPLPGEMSTDQLP